MKYDRESAYRRIPGLYSVVISVIAIAFSLFQLYTAAFGVLPAQIQRAVHLGFGVLLAFLLYPASKRGIRKLAWYDVVLAVIGAFVMSYLVWNFKELLVRAGAYTTFDIVIGAIGILLVLEATRRVVGIPILVVVCCFLAYAYFGRYVPGFFQHRGASITRLVGHMFFTTEGMFGIPLGVSSTFIFLFILFGAFLEKTGIGQFFIDIANSVAGHAAGGPAKVAVITSALEGTVSGSSVANTVGSGSFTIPMMKRLGYRPEFAGAVEASASTGGQIMPPIMGAAAFLMAEFIGVPYLQVAKSAIIPAILYFTGVFIVVHLEAKKTGLRGLPRERLPRFWAIMRERGQLFLPLVAIIYLLVEGSTPMKAALWGLVVAVLASCISRATRMKPADILAALEQGARNALGVVIACAAAGMIVGTVTLTGLGLKLANGLILLARGQLLPTLFFTMVTSLVLGMGAPTTANYVITSTIAAPALLKLGVPVMAAHMFAFYFGIVADVTPPVALAAFAGSGIAKSNPIKTGIEATKLSIAAFLIPYFFVYAPSLLLVGTMSWLDTLRVVAGAVVGMIAVGAAVEGWLLTSTRNVERPVLFVAGLLLIHPHISTDLLGILLIGVVWLAQMARLRRRGVSRGVTA
ncbi:MAG: TRAP transporter permease [Firmicutes bacterium]|nr:TRAP transporter permease [Bacillota bacterium]MDH7494487.1 TRAP transporter permease [Bacillota bacterium]